MQLQIPIEPPNNIILNQCEVREIHTDAIFDFINKYHYLGYCPAGAKYRIGLFYQGHMVGACLMGRPVARHENQNDLEITRFVLHPNCPKNTASWFLSRCLKIAKKDGYKRVISYADTAEGHTGAIYKACNFRCVGEKKITATWANREGRRYRKPSIKIKYEIRL
jgi:hypothetical protein